MKTITRDEAFTLLKKYNKDPFHIQHALTVEAVMKWYANELGYGEDAEYWGIVGLLHDIDFEQYPDQHCIKAPELLREGGADDALIHAVCSHGYGITVDIQPEHEMEKVLFAADELRPDLGHSADASLQEHQGSGAEIGEEEVQAAQLRRRLFP